MSMVEDKVPSGPLAGLLGYNTGPLVSVVGRRTASATRNCQPWPVGSRRDAGIRQGTGEVSARGTASSGGAAVRSFDKRGCGLPPCASHRDAAQAE